MLSDEEKKYDLLPSGHVEMLTDQDLDGAKSEKKKRKKEKKCQKQNNEWIQTIEEKHKRKKPKKKEIKDKRNRNRDRESDTRSPVFIRRQKHK